MLEAVLQMALAEAHGSVGALEDQEVILVYTSMRMAAEQAGPAKQGTLPATV